MAFYVNLFLAPNGERYRLGVGVDSAWEQRKLEVRKMPEHGDESHLSSARFVGRRHLDAASSFLRSLALYKHTGKLPPGQGLSGLEQS
jgi:hypothetical protein